MSALNAIATWLGDIRWRNNMLRARRFRRTLKTKNARIAFNLLRTGCIDS